MALAAFFVFALVIASVDLNWALCCGYACFTCVNDSGACG